jgi:hypothetical protein
LRRIGILIIISIVAFANQGSAQETREEQRAAEQAKKAGNLQLYVPGPIEKYASRIENTFQNPPPVYAFIGGVFPGGAIALGPGVRHRFTSGAFADVHGAWSIKNYKIVDASLKLPPFVDRRIAIETHANWLDAPKVAFFGLGGDTPKSNRTTFLYRTKTAGASARVRLLPLLSVGGGLDYLDVTTDRGSDSSEIEERFTPATAPGLRVNPTYTHSHAFAAIDWRDGEAYSRNGGLYRLDWSSYAQRQDDRFSFSRIDAEANQFVPLFQSNWVLAFRALGTFTSTDDGSQVPYFLMPSLGGSTQLRGYASWRFRERNRLLVTGEYRWLAGQFVDMAIFLDAGKVAARSADLDPDGLRTSFGIGIRLHTPAATVFRTELARTSDGLGLVFAFGPSF